MTFAVCVFFRIIQRTRSELEKLREDIHNLWEYVTSNEDSATTKSPEGDKSTRNTPNPKTPDPKQAAAVKGKGPKTPSTKDQLEMILRQFNKLKGENSTLYSYVLYVNWHFLIELPRIEIKIKRIFFFFSQDAEGERRDCDRCWKQA